MMRQFTACILKPRGPFHVGDREGMREGSETFIHSDTLFAAICHSYLLLYGKPRLEELLASSPPPLLLTSAFPFCNDTFYFPVPRNKLPKTKEQKRLRFVAQAEFERLLAGGELSDASLGAGLPSGIIQTDDVPKVTVPRLTCHQTEEAGAFYHLGLTWFRDTALFFLLDINPDWTDKVRAAIRLMCDEGVGGYRSIGKGQFEQPVEKSITLNVPDDADAWLTLSLFYPDDHETQTLAQGFYDLITRRGYIFSPDNRSLRRKQVMMFAEGSVFPGKGCQGRLVDVTPDNSKELGLPHKVWRNGLAFGLPCRLAHRGHSEPAARVEESLSGQKGGSDA